MHFNLEEMITTIGIVGLFGVIFAESGLFFGFFLPGDSLLVTAGLLASQGFFRIEVLMPLLIFAAIAGDSVGYWFGRKVGQAIFKKEDTFLFKKSHITKAHAFYEKHGGKTIIIARFIPIIRTFAPIVAGAVDMTYKKFISFNVFGGIFWVSLMLLFGYFLGNVFPNIDKYLLPVIAVIILLSILPGIIEVFKNNKEKIFTKIKSTLNKS
ncbi:MAG TPA: VTT domain-containing protein [Patescibacteria group bacterium]|nr:VTT domain-containing protein [Patescibacteria group bacterium]